MRMTDPGALDRLIGSACALPETPLGPLLADLGALGYRRFEAFTDWVASALDWRPGDPGAYRALGERHGVGFAALHLPRFADDDPEGSLSDAVAAARFAAALGMSVVYPRATSVTALARVGVRFLDATDGLGLTRALEIHSGCPVHDVASLCEAFDALGGDPRVAAVLEVGHLHLAGETWEDAWRAVADPASFFRVVHLKDVRGGQNVPLGEGEIDLRGMLARLRAEGYDGEFVVELLLRDRPDPRPALAAAREFVRPYFGAEEGEDG